MNIILRYLVVAAIIIPIIIIPFAMYIYKAKENPESGFYGYPNFKVWVLGTLIPTYAGLLIAIAYLKIRGH